MEHKCGKFSVLSFGFALGVAAALYVLFIGISAWLLDWGTPVVAIMGTLYIGYKATLIGSLIGAVWSFIDGFIGGVIFAAVYNCCVSRCCGRCETKERPTTAPISPSI